MIEPFRPERRFGDQQHHGLFEPVHVYRPDRDNRSQSLRKVLL
jgi:hypothetical protein